MYSSSKMRRTTMRSNEEKLVRHIFDGSNWIIQHVKQQTYLYQQYLACNLLIQGINPPPWFLNPNSHSLSSLPQEINKEELISDLLLPHARPAFPYSTGQCYLQSRLVVTGENVMSLVEFPKDIHKDNDSNNSLGGRDELKLVHESHDYDDGYNSNCIPRRSCTSSHDREDARVANISNKSSHSGQSQGWSQIYQQAVMQDHGYVSDGSLLEVNASNKSLGGSIEPMDLPDNHDADFGCIPNSPANQNVARISDLDIAPDQSLVRFQRSKSRQKALELRTSAKATKSRFSNDNKTISFSGVALYGIDVEEPDHSKDLLVMEKSSEMNKKSSVERVSSTDLSSKSGTSNNCGRITRSKSNCKRQSSFSEPLKLDVSHENVRKNSGKESCVIKRAKGRDQGMENGAGGSCGQITRSKSSCIQHICLNKSLETGRSSTIQFENGEELFQCIDNDNLLVSKETEVVIPFHASGEASDLRDAAMEKCKVMEVESSKYLDVVTRSIDSSRQPSSMEDSVDAVGLGAASYIPKVGDSSCDEFSSKLNPPLDKGTEVQEVVQPLTELDGNMNKSEKTFRNEGLVLSVKSSSIGIADLKDTHSRSFATEEYPLLCSVNMPDGNGHKDLSNSPLVSSLNMLDGSGLKDLSDSKVILPVTRTSATLNKETVPSAMAIELEGLPRCFRSTLDNANLRTESEVVSVRLASDAVQPKQLHFDGLEDYRLNEHYIPSSVMKSPEQSSGRRCRKLLEPEASLEKSKSDYPSKKQLLGKSGASKGKNKAQRPFESNREDCNENERTSQPYRNESPQVKHDEDDLKAGLYICYSPTEKDVSPSDLHEISYLDVRDPNCHVMEGCPEQCIDKGHFFCERWTRSEIVPQTSQQEHLGSSVVPCLTKLATEDSKSCLDKDENLKNKLDYVLDARRDFRVDDEKNVLQHQHNFGCKNINNLVGTEKMDLVEGCFNLIEEGLSISGSVGDPHDEDNNFGSLGFGETQPTYTSSLSKYRSRHKKDDSWPQSERRMIEDQQTHCFSASPSFRVQRLHDIQVEHSEDVFYAESNLPAVCSSHEQNFCWRSDLFNEKMECLLIDETLSSPMFRRQQVEGEIGFEEKTKVGETPSASEHEKLGQCFLSSLSKQANKDLQGFFVEDYTTSYLAANNLREEHKFQKIFHVGDAEYLADGDILTSTKSALIDSNSLLKEGNPVGSPCNKELAFDQNLRVNEGCVLNERSDNEELDSSINGIDFGELNTTCTSIQRASILEQICRTASMCTPLSQFSSTYKPLKNEDLSVSLPNGLLEHTNLTCTLPLGDDAGNQLRATSTDEADFALRAMLSSDCLPYSGAPYGWISKNSGTPPAGKYCERIPSKSMSSEKLLGSNPELTCFPIEEDPIVDDENENADEDDGSIQEDVGFTEINNCAIGEALLRTEKVLPNPPASISQIEKFHHIGDLHSSNGEVLSSVKQRLRNYRSNRKSQNRGKEIQLSSVGSNSIEKVSESLQNRFNKEKLSSTSSIKRGSQRLSEKVKRNNIVSNVTSFIPLVQQKQAAAVCKAKRDIKVRALEAAEAAKRLEEKKENERKIKKEALQLERVKIEQETLRQRELDKRKKEEELKKKDADIAARKRLREEEGRKEKERKRKRVGGSQNHRAQEGKIFAGKVGREKQFGNKGIKTNRKESSHRIGKDQSVDILSGKGNSLKKLESQTESKTTGCNILRVSTVSENCETLSDCDGSRKLTSMLNQLPFRSVDATKTSHEKSYEMSPYQHSDDEDEEEDEFPPNKFIPSWASRNSVALVLRSQQIDPSVIFPRESFCRIDEVVLPRHLH